VFEAIHQATSIGKSIMAEEEPEPKDLALAARTALDAVRQAGFLRALLMPRFMDVLLKVPAEVRRTFVEAAIALKICKSCRISRWWIPARLPDDPHRFTAAMPCLSGGLDACAGDRPGHRRNQHNRGGGPPQHRRSRRDRPASGWLKGGTDAA